MNNSQVATAVQSLLMVVGSWFAATGHADSSTVQTAIGGVSALLGLFWNHYAALQAGPKVTPAP
jgi:hypothetical protein